MSSTIRLPDILANWPCQLSINPHHEKVSMESHKWMEDYKVLPEHAQARFNRCDFPLLVALAYPDVCEEQLRIISDFHMWFFLFDEITDVKSGKTTGELSENVINTMRDPSNPLPRSVENPTFLEMSQDLWLRVYSFSVPKSAQDLFVYTKEYIEDVVTEAEDRDKKYVRNVANYFDIRRGTAAPMVIYFLGLLHVELPDEVLNHPSVQKLTELAGDLIAIHNDIYSYNIERVHGTHGHNLVTVVMKEKTLRVQAAVDYCAAMFHQISAEFLDRLGNLPKFTPEEEKALKIHCACILNWPVALDEWSFLSQRYFESERFQIRRTRTLNLAVQKEGWEYDTISPRVEV
ncbi:hypothetical protein M422DRAFT_181402 [Sphaerobolus stellatus SS14]|uniref:Terpene synthase n=1 Tax=Sphaerobolus stellatus (strain SS14) TaxID=990650 RepID=A0A0C9V049_SPHS4|nr:hypothetical protein M422DRAFT_181402 [Sphaerobolus stellatus SS14]